MDAGRDGEGAGKAPPEGPAEATTVPPAPVPASAPGSSAGTSGSGEKPVKRVMKTPYQLEVLEYTYAGLWNDDFDESIQMFFFVFFLPAGFLGAFID